MIEAKHLMFIQVPQEVTGTTKAFVVNNKHSGIRLGTIEWSDKEFWNCYAFFPLPNTMYEEDCLRDIANFCEELTKEEK